MADYFEMDRQQLEAEHEAHQALYKQYQSRGL